MFNSLQALAPLDGRYSAQVEALRAFFSEMALMKFRCHVEIEWMIFMTKHHLIPNVTIEMMPVEDLRAIIKEFSLEDAKAIKSIETTTRHDVKAVEYFLKTRAQALLPAAAMSFWHFGCTSEDINNLAYALMLKSAMTEVIRPELQKLKNDIAKKALEYAHIPLLARTHGQSASPSTLGKELANFAYRLERQLQRLSTQEFLGKFNGAVGNFNAQRFSHPEQDWPELAKKFVSSLGLTFNPMVTQIEPHDFIAEISHLFIRINTILLDCARDIWVYISQDYFKLMVVSGEVGSSTMPHKVNPIDFENAEGNLGLANALFTHFAEKLPISRLQRDLSDSTVLRNLGCAFGYALIAYQALFKGFTKITPQTTKISHDLASRYEILTEAVQTLLRAHGVGDAYEKLKAASQGEHFDEATYLACIDELDLPSELKVKLKALQPQIYTGFAAELVKEYLSS